MSRYWIGDALGRILGPVSLEVLRDLLRRGRLQNLTRASTDGRTWKPIEQVAEVFALVSGAASPGREPEPPDEAARLSAELERLRALSPRARLGLLPSAGLVAARLAFFAKVKQFHPSKLPPGASVALQQAYRDMFRLLSEAMEQLEREQPRPDAAPAPTYSPEQFVGVRRENDRIEVELELGQENAHLLNDCPQASAANDGFFLPCGTTLPLLQEVEVTLRFKDSRRELRGRGRVVLNGSGGAVPGLGIRFLSLGAEDRRFLQYFARKAAIGTGPG